jgi:hypothetical protein
MQGILNPRFLDYSETFARAPRLTAASAGFKLILVVL